MFYDNLKSICDSKNIKITPLVTDCGGAKGSISNWKKGASPNSDIVINLAVRLNVSTDLLLLGKEANSSDNQELIDLYEKLTERDQTCVLERARTLHELEIQKANSKSIETPTLLLKHSYYKVSAGTGFWLDDYDKWEEINVPQSVESRRADFCLTITGNSMEPIYYNGDIVLVKSQQQIERGQIGIFTIENCGYIKKFGGDRLISLNAEYDDILFSDYNPDYIRCNGLVIGRV